MFKGIWSVAFTLSQLSLLLLGHVPALGQEKAKDSDKEIKALVEDASFAYTSQYASMDRYLAYYKGEREWISSHPEDGAAAYDFEGYYGLFQEPGNDKDTERSEFRAMADYSNGVSDNELSTILKRGKDHWSSNSGGDVVNLATLEKGRYSVGLRVDPFTLPIDYLNVFDVREESNLREVVNYMMPAGRLFRWEIDSLDRCIGLWKHGVEEELGYTEVIFDPKYGNMPSEMIIRTLKDGQVKVDVKKPENGTELYQKNETKWYKHTNGMYLPSEVRCTGFQGGSSSWKVQIEWWVGKEVPDEVFELEDVKKAHIRASVVDKLYQERLELRKNNKPVEEGKKLP